ncbi:MAG TPA: LytTR family DNA-binding domain-containing protein [Terriglobales bacterium]|nr:LytTR family DNA-binding domain-containing protein [Terriglobales bacterium]
MTSIYSSRDHAYSTDFLGPTIRTVLADDEALARQKLNILLSAESGIEVLAECRNAGETLAALRAYRPDLLLLDVQMPDADGFDVLKQVPPEQMPIVVFTTAYDQYAIQAFEAHALDYLLKPFDQERLHRALERVRNELLRPQNPEMTRRLIALLQGVKPKPSGEQRLVIRAGGKVVFLEVNEIEWIEAAANYVRVHAGPESYMLRANIGRIAEKLDPAQFARIHRSTIVNIREIRELQPCNSGEFIVVLRNGKELSGSRGYRVVLQDLISRRSLH